MLDSLGAAGLSAAGNLMGRDDPGAILLGLLFPRHLALGVEVGLVGDVLGGDNLLALVALVVESGGLLITIFLHQHFLSQFSSRCEMAGGN